MGNSLGSPITFIFPTTEIQPNQQPSVWLNQEVAHSTGQSPFRVFPKHGCMSFMCLACVAKINAELKSYMISRWGMKCAFVPGWGQEEPELPAQITRLATLSGSTRGSVTRQAQQTDDWDAAASPGSTNTEQNWKFSEQCWAGETTWDLESCGRISDAKVRTSDVLPACMVRKHCPELITHWVIRVLCN